jgi:hypothetical protein
MNVKELEGRRPIPEKGVAKYRLFSTEAPYDKIFKDTGARNPRSYQSQHKGSKHQLFQVNFYFVVKK